MQCKLTFFSFRRQNFRKGHDSDRGDDSDRAQDPILCKTLIETNDIHKDEFSRPLGKLKIRKNIWMNFPEFTYEG